MNKNKILIQYLRTKKKYKAALLALIDDKKNEALRSKSIEELEVELNTFNNDY